MAFYLGNDNIKRKIIIDNVAYRLNIPINSTNKRTVTLLTKDHEQLKDITNIKLSVLPVTTTALLDKDGNQLYDVYGLILKLKGDELYG